MNMKNFFFYLERNIIFENYFMHIANIYTICRHLNKKPCKIRIPMLTTDFFWDKKVSRFFDRNISIIFVFFFYSTFLLDWFTAVRWCLFFIPLEWWHTIKMRLFKLDAQLLYLDHYSHLCYFVNYCRTLVCRILRPMFKCPQNQTTILIRMNFFFKSFFLVKYILLQSQSIFVEIVLKSIIDEKKNIWKTTTKGDLTYFERKKNRNT